MHGEKERGQRPRKLPTAGGMFDGEKNLSPPDYEFVTAPPQRTYTGYGGRNGQQAISGSKFMSGSRQEGSGPSSGAFSQPVSMKGSAMGREGAGGIMNQICNLN